MPKGEIFNPFFFTPVINPIWVGDLRTGEKKKNFLKAVADIRYFVFFRHAEYALNNGLSTLSVR